MYTVVAHPQMPVHVDGHAGNRAQQVTVFAAAMAPAQFTDDFAGGDIHILAECFFSQRVWGVTRRRGARYGLLSPNRFMICWRSAKFTSGGGAGGCMPPGPTVPNCAFESLAPAGAFASSPIDATKPLPGVLSA